MTRQDTRLSSYEPTNILLNTNWELLANYKSAFIGPGLATRVGVAPILDLDMSNFYEIDSYIKTSKFVVNQAKIFQDIYYTIFAFYNDKTSKFTNGNITIPSTTRSACTLPLVVEKIDKFKPRQSLNRESLITAISSFLTNMISTIAQVDGKEITSDTLSELNRVRDAINIENLINSIESKYLEKSTTFSGYYIDETLCNGDEESVIVLLSIDSTIKLLIPFYQKDIRSKYLNDYRLMAEKEKVGLQTIVTICVIGFAIFMIILLIMLYIKQNKSLESEEELE